MDRKKGRRLSGAAPAGGAGAGPIDGTPADRLQRFTILAWPRTEPPGLNTIPAGEVVYFERKVRPYTSGTMQAGELLRDIGETIARQTEGYFTLNEAAQVLAESRPDLDPLEAIKGFRKAREAGRLCAYHGDRGKGRFPVVPGAAIREHLDLLKAAELDAWLRESVGYGFPAHSAPATAPLEPPRDRGRRVKRKALLSDNVRRWPTIERDLKDCAKNGLSAAAKDESHGWWWEDSAREWARARGKWKDEAAAASLPWGHQLRG
jgi:hypothetical protein